MFEKFKFRKFNPDPETVTYANTMLSQVMDLAPDNSNCYASLAKIGDSYTGWLEITFAGGHFSAESRADDPRLALDILEDRIKSRIKKWKTQRKLIERDESWKWPAFDNHSGLAS